jgi:hypothetical protein
MLAARESAVQDKANKTSKIAEQQTLARQMLNREQPADFCPESFLAKAPLIPRNGGVFFYQQGPGAGEREQGTGGQ